MVCDKPNYYFYHNNVSGRALSDTHMLQDLRVEPNGTIQLEVISSNPLEYPIKNFSQLTEKQTGFPYIITVNVCPGRYIFNTINASLFTYILSCLNNNNNNNNNNNK